MAIIAIAVAILPVEAATPRDRSTSVRPTAAAQGTDSWIVTLRKGHEPRSEAKGLAAAAGGRATYVFRYALQGFVFRGSAKAARALGRNHAVRTIVADESIQIAAETTPDGIRRIRARHPTQPDAHEAGFTGAGVRIAILDTGIDLDHPDLNVDAGAGLNCMTAGPPEDGHGHGTHVAGTAAAIGDNGIGVVGVAPGATVVPFKVLDDTGYGEWSNLICAVDYLTGLMTDGDASNDIPIANMSLGDVGSPGTCNDGGIRQAICTSVAAGVTYIAAAGNSSVDTSTFIPAAFPEVIAVSALTDLDGEPGGLGGCFIFILCDDGLAYFSNYGPAVDVTAPGVQVYSTWKNGGYSTADGTSMASPHVAGVAALIRSADPALGPSAIRNLLVSTGENPDGSFAEGSCGGGGQWDGDPDGIAEPLVNALRAAQIAASGPNEAPTVTLTAPTNGAVVSGTAVALSATASDSDGIAGVTFLVDGVSVGVDSTSPYGVSWDSTTVIDGSHDIRARAVDGLGHQGCSSAAITVGPNAQGDWVGTYGHDGYAEAAWFDNTATGDQVALPAGTSLALTQGLRSFVGVQTPVRVLEDWDESERRVGAWYHSTQLKLRLDFATAYAGTLHLYALDWASTSRRASYAVADGTTTKTISVTTAFDQGAWMHFPVDVPAGGHIDITATRTAGSNVVLNGLFLGGVGAPPAPGPTPTPTPSPSPSPTSAPTPTPSPSPTPPYESAPQGDWVGTYGVDGYVLGAWSGTTDLLSLPAGAGVALVQGLRDSQGIQTQLRALEDWDESERRVAAWYHASQLRLRLDFANAYAGALHLYALDWSSTTRRASYAVADGTNTTTITVTTPFDQGAWMHFPITVAAGGHVDITGTRIAGANVLLNGVFLGGAGAPPPPGPAATPTPSPTPSPSPSPSPTSPPVPTPTPSPTSPPAPTPTPSPSPSASPSPSPSPSPTSPPAPTPTPSPSPEPPYESAPQGDWVGIYGQDGYALGAWTGTTSSGDLRALPVGATLSLVKGARSSGGIQTQVRVLEDWDESERRIGAWYQSRQLKLRLDFPTAYAGTLHLYALDWASTARRARYTVADGTNTTTVNVTTRFDQGAWMHFPVNTPAGGHIDITANRTAGTNVVLNGIFFGGAGSPPPPGP
jgi:hypothetical protein